MDHATRIATEVRVQVWTLISFSRLVARHPPDGTGDSGEAGLDEFDEISIKGGWIEIGCSDLVDYLGMGKWSLGTCQ
jgi:hypothetical protein